MQCLLNLRLHHLPFNMKKYKRLVCILKPAQFHDLARKQGCVLLVQSWASFPQDQKQLSGTYHEGLFNQKLLLL